MIYDETEERILHELRLSKRLTRSQLATEAGLLLCRLVPSLASLEDKGKVVKETRQRENGITYAVYSLAGK